MPQDIQASSLQFASHVLEALSKPSAAPSDFGFDEAKTRNAAACMTELLLGRLAQSGNPPEYIEGTTYRWGDGILNLRNAVKDHLWTNLRPTFVQHFRELKDDGAGVYVMTAWEPSGSTFHVWAIPEEIVFVALPNHPVGKMTEKRTVRIIPGTHRFERCTDSPYLLPFYKELEWGKDERDKLDEAVATDEVARQRNKEDEGSMESENEVFFLKGKDAEATGKLTEEGFVVRKGATARKEVVPSASNSITPVRQRMLEEEAFVENGNVLRLTKDYIFDSPSGAASAFLGRSANGWKEWKLPDGRTLSQIKRISRSDEPLLDAEKRDALIAKHEELLNEGRVYTKAQLDGYYATFREKFGPNVLSGLDGEPLLTFIHDHGNRDSLVYWLEFKNDEEFDTKQFGSIAGGSALKFRIFRRKETGHWQAGDEKGKPTDIPLEEAIEYARNHRDQLLKGVELLEQLPEDASDEDYAELQDRMDEVAPDVSNLAWGHKYFSLLFPEKLDDFHSPDWQRFHILKLLQLPPEGDGRYICAGRFVAAAREVDLPMNPFTGALNAVQGRLHRYWRIGTRGGSEKVSHWPMMQQRDCVAIGWPDLGDLSWVEAKKASREKLKQLIHDKHPSSPQAEGKAASEITHFIATVNEGDIVWAADGAKILGIGRITGEYRFEQEFDFPHQRSVEWLSFDEWKMPKNPVKKLTSGPEERIEKPVKASGKLRHEKRIHWWNDYRDAFCVFGHYSIPDGDPRGGEAAFCVDYGVGKRWTERRAGKSSGFDLKLAALRWPERVVVFDEGGQITCERFN